MNWDDLRYFLKVTETGGLSPAARFLRVNTTTVGRHIETLEAALGRKLFDRSPQGYRLTEAGERLFAQVRRIESEIAGIETSFDATPDEATGNVLLATSDALAMEFLIPTLPELHRRHPGIEISVTTSNMPVNLSRREAEVALRLSLPEQGNLVSRHVGDVGIALYASPDYLARAGRPTRAGDFAGHAAIGWPLETVRTLAEEWRERVMTGARVIMRANNTGRVVAARAGLGISALACFTVPRSSGLVRLPVEPAPPWTPLWLIAHADLAHQPRVRAVMDHVVDVTRRYAGFLRGDEAAMGPDGMERV